MKKTILLLAFFLSLTTISCSSDDSDQTSNFINPPEWIIGTWLDKSEPAWAQTGGFKFTNNNLLDVSSNNEVTINLKEGLQDAVDAGIITTNEIITSEKYELKIISSGTVTSNYKFSKGTNGESIIYALSTIKNIILTKQ